MRIIETKNLKNRPRRSAGFYGLALFPILLAIFLAPSKTQAAFPSIAATNSGNSGGNMTSHTVNLPANISSGNLLIAVISFDATSTLTASWPSGWTQLFFNIDTTNNVALSAAYRRADGNEGSTITVTTNNSEGSAHTTYRITGHHSTTNPVAGTAVSGASVNPDPPSLSAPWGAEDTLWLAVYGWDTNKTNSGYPANYTLGQATDRYNQTDHGNGVASAGRERNASSEDPGTATISASDEWVANTIAIRSFVASNITLGTGTDPSSATVAPGSGIRDAGAFTLQSAGNSDSVTALTVTLAGSGTPYDGVSEVRITSNDGGTTYFSAVSNPSSNTINFSGGTPIPVTTTQTQFKIRITPKTHANMPAVPGASYALSPYVSDWTLSGGNTKAGSDSNSNTLTIDNASPNGATSASGTGGTSSVALVWTTSSSSDFSRSVVLRWATSSPGSDVPAEGTDYTISDSIGGAQVVCVRTTDGASTAVTDAEDGVGTGGCRSASLSPGTYSYKVFQKDSNGNYDAGVTFTNSPFTIVSNDPKPVFFSVSGGGDTSDKKTGTPTVTLSSGTATFSEAQTGNIGVGDVITYDTDKVCYISGKTSQTVWTCATATGGIPTDISNSTVVSIKRAFTTLSSAEAGAPTLLGTSDLVTANIQLNFPCYYDTGADTTAVTIDGWTTGADNYIKVFTPIGGSESNQNQRHAGYPGSGNYRLHTSSAGNSFTVTVLNIELDGLEIYNSSTGVSDEVIRIDTDNVALKVKNSLLYLSATRVSQQDLIYINDRDGCTVSLENTIGWNAYRNVVGFYVHEYVEKFATVSINSCTFYNIGTNDTTSVEVRNGLIGANGRSALGSKATLDGAVFNTLYHQAGFWQGQQVFHKGPYSNLSVSVDRLITNATTINNAGTVTDCLMSRNFVDDETGYSGDWHVIIKNATVYPYDLRLAYSDRNIARDAHFDSSGAGLDTPDFDIAGIARPHGLGFDVGAHESSARVTFSVSGGADTSDKKTGTPTVSLSSGTATFSEAQTGNIGVGDAITYDTDKVCYISGKTSTVVWTCATATGGTPTDISNSAVVSIKRVFTSLSNAESGAPELLGTSDLVTGNYQLSFSCYYDTGADTQNVTIDGWTTGADNYIKVFTPNNTTTEANFSQRHSGKWDDSKWRLQTSSGHSFSVKPGYSRIEGLQIQHRNAGEGSQMALNYHVASNNDCDVRISHNIIRRTSDNPTYSSIGLLIWTYPNAGSKVSVYNNLVYDFGRGNSSSNAIGIQDDNGSGRIYVYNNTVYNVARGFSSAIANSGIIKNNISQDCTDGFYGPFSSGSDYNISDLASDAPSPSYRSGLATTVQFADPDNFDFHLSPSDTSAKDKGASLCADPYLAFNTDIDGDQRICADGKWDIGADENTETLIELKPGTQLKRGVELKVP